MRLKSKDSSMGLMRVTSTLPPTLEDLIERTIGCCLTVHRELGPGMAEQVYARACAIELRENGIACQREKPVPIRYRGQHICTQRIDLLVDGLVVLEVKSVERIHPVHVAQAVAYLRATNLRAGLVINFNVVLLRDGIRRVVL
jgi:GxxExxY protein